MSAIRKLIIVFLVLFAVQLHRMWQKLSTELLQVPTSLPELKDHLWGGKEMDEVMDGEFYFDPIVTSKEQLLDLSSRLRMTMSVSDDLIDSNHTYGISSQTLLNITDYWINRYSYKQREKEFNRLQFKMLYRDHLKVQYYTTLHDHESGKRVRDLLVLHDWPDTPLSWGNFVAYVNYGQKGTDYVFNVMGVSYPGFGHSEEPKVQGMTALHMAKFMLRLMEAFAMKNYYIHAHGYGALVASYMSLMDSKNIKGLHLTNVWFPSPLSELKAIAGAILPSGIFFSPKEEELIYPLKEKVMRVLKETGHTHMQITKPDTLGVSLLNSPVGLAAYLLDIYSSWTDRENPLKSDGGLLTDFPIKIDYLLDNICHFWFTESILTSMRVFAEHFTEENLKHRYDEIPVTVPTGIVVYPQHLMPIPRHLADYKYKNIITYTKMPSGGHFPHLEDPQRLATDLKLFVHKQEKVPLPKDH